MTLVLSERSMFPIRFSVEWREERQSTVAAGLSFQIRRKSFRRYIQERISQKASMIPKPYASG
jgi:hypothetical protein